MSVLVDHRRTASERVIGISAFRAIRELLFENLAERIALERLREAILVGVGNRPSRTIIGNGKRRKRLASVEAFHAGNEPGIVVCVLRHDSVCVRHADGRVEGIVANLCDVANGVFHENWEAGLVVRDLRLAASVVHGRHVASLVTGNPRRDCRSSVRIQKRNRDGFASLRVGERGDGLDRALAVRAARRPRETAEAVVLEVAVVAEALADARHVSALRVVAVGDEVVALAVDYLPDLAEIGDVVAHEVVDCRLAAGKVGNREHAVLLVVAVRGRAVSLVAEMDAFVVGIREVAVGDDARRATGLLEGDLLVHRALRNRREVVAAVAEADGV